jgi:hypothetical protein
LGLARPLAIGSAHADFTGGNLLAVALSAQPIRLPKICSSLLAIDD